MGVRHKVACAHKFIANCVRNAEMGVSMLRYIHLYKIFLLQYLKSLLQSKLDFFMGFFSFFLNQILGIIFLQLVFSQIPDLNGWSFEQLVFIYGFAQIPKGIDHFFTDYLWVFCRKTVREGAFDRYLLRPVNPLFQVLVERCQPDGLGEVLVGVILVAYAGAKLRLSFSVFSFFVFLIAVFAGSVIYTAVKLFFASNAFFMKECYNMLYTAYNISDFAKYPTEIYTKPVRLIVSFVLPFAFTAFIPANYFINGGTLLLSVGAECLVAAAAFLIAYLYFSFGIKKYESAGS